ncbi:MAG: CRTAC1 family protein, partial [Pseudomonadota bacterium]
VANDGVANSYWVNQGELKFIDDAFLAGSAVNADGAAEASMGVDAADFDRNGGEDIFITHLKRETNTLYSNDGKGWFSDATTASLLGPPSLPFTGFGTAFVDIDNNGWLDLVVVNGAVVVEQAQVQVGSDFPYRQSNQIFRNTEGRFEDATQRGGQAFRPSHSSRGAAFGDINNDGRVDLVIVNNHGPARILINQAAANHWLGLRLTDSEGERDLTGSVVWLLEQGKKSWSRRSRSDGSYASANDPRIVLGLVNDDQPQAIVVRWPDGQHERFIDLSVDQYHVIRKGQGSE